MASPPRRSLWPSLATCFLIATLAWSAPVGARAAAAGLTPIQQAWSLYYQGKALQARRGLEDYLGSPEGQTSDERLIVLETLLDICLQGLAEPCLAEYAPVYADLAGRRPFANDVQKIEAARRAGYYLFAAQAPQASPAGLAAIAASGNWKLDHPYDVGLYLRRRALAANINLRLGRVEEANRDVDKVLSLIASLDDANSIRPAVIWALSDVMETLLALGDTERALGLLRASSTGIGATLPPRSYEAALFALRGGLVLDAAGRPEKSRALLDLAVTILDEIELDPEIRSRLLAAALTTKANLCNAVDVACARDALARHPFRELYASADRAPGSLAEIEYLEARAATAAIAGAPDPVVAAALQRPLAFAPKPDEVEAVRVYQAMGRALASAPGEARSAALREAARHVRALARQARPAPFGAWRRSGSSDQGVLRLTLAQAEGFKGDDGADVVFTLMQLVQRRGQTFDADALTVLGQARTALERRAIHQALRLRVRRDALEREKIKGVTERFAAEPVAPPKPDFAVRHQFRDYAERIRSASAGLAEAGLSTAGANLVTLEQMQAALAPNEAALMLTPTTGDALVYMCIRRDATLRRVVSADLSTLRLDARLVQAALTAGHAPSEALDAQYPVTAATRLYDVFIRPFEPCLKPGDHILWLPGLSLSGFPLAALLEQAPPKLERGYDLSQAAWLVRSHAVSYAGSAGVVVALRKAPAPPAAQFDFLGVGDPEFSGVTPGGEDRARIVTRGVRASAGVSILPALPETEDELRRSAAGFRKARLLLEDAASEGGFRRELAGAYRYLSFATHGLIRDDLQGLSEPALALTPVSSALSFDDGLLTAPEIADLNLSARFVALSACNTANFDISQMAQDLPALASAFAVAGVPATLGTLWPVDSTTGMDVVAGVFEHLRAGRAPALALADAQRAFLADPPSRAHLHPRFWAPFVVLGDGGVASVAEGASAPLKVNLVETPRGQGEILRIAREEGGGVATQDRQSMSAWSRGFGLEPGAILVGSARLDARRTIFASQSRDAGAQAARLSVFLVEDRGAPRRLFDIERRGSAAVGRASFVQVGEAVLVAYSARTFVAPPTSPIFQDDFDQALCASEPQTRIEVHDLATGALEAEADLEGRFVNAAARWNGEVLLGGQAQAACGEGRAAVLAVDKTLKVRDLYLDDSLGASDVRTLAALPDGRIFVAASKDNTVAFRTPSKPFVAPSQDDVAGALYGGMAFLIGPGGRLAAPLLLDAGTTLTVDDADASQPHDILLGGGIGKRPAIFHLSAAPAR